MVRAAVAIIGIALAGCLPRTTVVKDPGPRDRGVRYYRPKPYLFVQPMLDDEGRPVQGMVALSIEYLPDYSEEYSIHVRTGLGTNKTEIALEDGWNLTSLNIDADSQFDENLKAVGELIGRAGPVLTARDATGGSVLPVPASNVPLGLYEAVLSPGPDGRKRLYGFRYVGFFPYAPCPIESGGAECRVCADTPIFGLVFENGTMVFRPLAETFAPAQPEALSAPASGSASLDDWITHVANTVAEHFRAASGLAITRSGGAGTGPETITVTLELPAEAYAQYQSASGDLQRKWHVQAVAGALEELETLLTIRLVVIGPPDAPAP